MIFFKIPGIYIELTAIRPANHLAILELTSRGEEEWIGHQKGSIPCCLG
jgi:hypothetical protein